MSFLFHAQVCASPFLPRKGEEALTLSGEGNETSFFQSSDVAFLLSSVMLKRLAIQYARNTPIVVAMCADTGILSVVTQAKADNSLPAPSPPPESADLPNRRFARVLLNSTTSSILPVPDTFILQRCQFKRAFAAIKGRPANDQENLALASGGFLRPPHIAVQRFLLASNP
jgi:hypothetical protein